MARSKATLSQRLRWLLPMHGSGLSRTKITSKQPSVLKHAIPSWSLNPTWSTTSDLLKHWGTFWWGRIPIKTKSKIMMLSNGIRSWRQFCYSCLNVYTVYQQVPKGQHQILFGPHQKFFTLEDDIDRVNLSRNETIIWSCQMAHQKSSWKCCAVFRAVASAQEGWRARCKPQAAGRLKLRVQSWGHDRGSPWRTRRSCKPANIWRTIS